MLRQSVRSGLSQGQAEPWCARNRRDALGRDSDFGKIGTISVLPSFAVQNDVETGKNCKCAAILIVFRRNSGVVLSYQAWRLPRIVRPSDMPVCGDRQFDIIF
jgi:hypothetical protein